MNQLDNSVIEKLEAGAKLEIVIGMIGEEIEELKNDVEDEDIYLTDKNITERLQKIHNRYFGEKNEQAV